MRFVRTTILTVAGGLLMAVVLFALTAPTLNPLAGPRRPDGTTIATDQAFTDWLTGEFLPDGFRFYTNTVAGEQRVMPPGTVSEYRAIPLPAGFVAGCLLTLVVIAVAARRPRRTASDSAVPAA